MESISSVVLIGAGNVSTRLGIVFKSIGLEVKCVYSKTAQSSQILAKRLDCPFTTDTKDIPLDADLYLLAIKDAAISEFIQHFRPKNGLVVHTSGSISLDTLSPLLEVCRIGVFYPLQTFSKEVEIDLSSTPFLIEGNDEIAVKLLSELAKKISNNVVEVVSNKRKQIHLSAVWINNFTNFMLTQAEKIAEKENLPFSIFEPLAKETIRKAFQFGAVNNQTGPAKRHDLETIESHYESLKINQGDDMADLYRFLSDYIMRECRV